MIRAFIRWAVVQFVAIFCFVAAIVLLFTVGFRPQESLVIDFAAYALICLFGMLAVNFQEWAFSVDELEDDRFTAMMIGRPSLYGKE